jgi:hypothetical protein
LKLVEWKDVERSIKYHYPEDKNDYSGLFKKLKLRPRWKTDPEEHIDIIVNQREGEIEGYFSIVTNKFSFSFRKWNELLNIKISEETLNNFLYEDIVAHFIWEITFYGDEKQIAKEKKEMNKRIKDMYKTKKK